METEIKFLRNKAKISQYQLSQRAKVSRFRLSLFECGYLELSSEEESRLKTALKDLIAEAHSEFAGDLDYVGNRNEQ